MSHKERKPDVTWGKYHSNMMINSLLVTRVPVRLGSSDPVLVVLPPPGMVRLHTALSIASYLCEHLPNLGYSTVLKAFDSLGSPASVT